MSTTTYNTFGTVTIGAILLRDGSSYLLLRNGTDKALLDHSSASTVVHISFPATPTWDEIVVS